MDKHRVRLLCERQNAAEVRSQAERLRAAISERTDAIRRERVKAGKENEEEEEEELRKMLLARKTNLDAMACGSSLLLLLWPVDKLFAIFLCRFKMPLYQ